MTNDAGEAWRLFIAVPLPTAAAARVHRALRPYASAFPAARWHRVDAFHVTLRFLGDTHPERVAMLAEYMRGCASGRGPFPMSTSTGDGVVRRSGGVAWLRIRQGEAEAVGLSRCLAGEQAPLEGAGGRARPHLTVARRVDAALIEALASGSMGSVAVDWVADRLVLYRSHTGTPAGSTYESLAEVRL